VIDQLGQPIRGRCPLLKAEDLLAEDDLLATCQRRWAVGLDGGRPIDYPYLKAPIGLPPASEVLDPELAWYGPNRGVLEHLLGLANQARERLKGYAGWLATELPFLEAARDLEAAWGSLPAAMRPGFPLMRFVARPSAPAGSSPASAATGAFAADFAGFCGRWGLVGMATWDLPLPQGPLLPSPWLGQSPTLPAEAVHLVLPVHYPMTGDENLLDRVREAQRALADRLGLDASVAGLPHYRIYGQMLEVAHHERTIARRYGAALRSPGSKQALIEALAESLGQSADQVARLRKEIAACRRGNRASIARLRPRAR
jgi:hypothetical protein